MRIAAGQSDSNGDSDPKSLCERGNLIATTGQFNYAIDLYLRAIAISPDDVEAHRGLRKIGLMRTAAGRRPLGLMDKTRATRGSTPEERICGAAKILACDPANVCFMLTLRQVAADCGLAETVKWLDDLIRKASRGID